MFVVAVVVCLSLLRAVGRLAFSPRVSTSCTSPSYGGMIVVVVVVVVVVVIVTVIVVIVIVIVVTVIVVIVIIGDNGAMIVVLTDITRIKKGCLLLFCYYSIDGFANMWLFLVCC